MKTRLTYRNMLIQALELKQSRNPAYSIGSFGRLLGVDASRMAQILHGKVGISVKRAVEFAEILKFNEHDSKMFVLLVQTEHERNPKRKREAQEKLNELLESYKDLTDNFSSICDWYHHAIVEMLDLTEPPPSIEVMARKIGVGQENVEEALARLETLGVIEKNDKGFYQVTTTNRRTRQDVPSEAVRVLNEQILEKAEYELRNQDVTERDYSVVFLKFNKSQLEKAKEKIKKFRREMLAEFELAPDKDSVYCMAIQFFEVTGKDEEN